MPSTARLQIDEIRAEGRKVIGTMITSTDPAVTTIAGSVGFDFVIIDMEHGPLTIETAQRHVLAARSQSMMVFVRVLENRPQLIQSVMDIGADAIIAPKTETPEDAAALARAVRYGPGGRGACPGVLSADYQFAGWDEFRQTSNANVLAIPLIETARGVANAAAIAAVDGVDAVFFGPVDYAQDTGVDYLGPQVQAAAISVTDATRDAGKLRFAAQFHAEDAEIIVDNADLMLLRQSFQTILAGHAEGRTA